MTSSPDAYSFRVSLSTQEDQSPETFNEANLPTEVPKRLKASRPPDRPIETFIDVAELESLMRLGREEAEAAIDGTGFVGGRINSAVSNGLASLFFGGIMVASLANLISSGLWLPYWSLVLPGGKAKAGTWIYIITFFGGLGSLPCAIRSFCLFHRRFRLSHISGCCLRIWMGLTNMLMGAGFAVVYSDYSTVMCAAGVVLSISGLMFLAAGIFSILRRFSAAQYIIEAMNFLLCVNFLCISLGGEKIGHLRWFAATIAVTFGGKFVADVQVKFKMSTAAYDYIKSDFEAYEAIWEVFTSVGANLQDLFTLETEIARCRSTVAGTDVVSHSSGDVTLTDGVRKKLQEVSLGAGTTKPRQRFDHLAVLYSHAQKLNGSFQAACAEWAARSGGGDHHAAAIKRRERAIEKLYRSYSGDARQVLDLVRAGITFDRVEDLVRCLRIVRRDPRVVILQVKNRLSTSFDGRLSAGYRNVALNLALVEVDTMKLGVDYHVAELQLGLRMMDDLKNEEGHANYVRFRNARAE